MKQKDAVEAFVKLFIAELDKYKAEMLEQVRINWPQIVEQSGLVRKDLITNIIDYIGASGFAEKLKPILSNMIGLVFQNAVSREADANKIPVTADPKIIDFLRNYSLTLVDDLGKKVELDIDQTIRQSVIRFESVRECMDRIKNKIAVSEKRAEVIARTELNRAQNAGQLLYYRELDARGFEVKKFFHLRLDNRNDKKSGNRFVDPCVRMAQRYDPRYFSASEFPNVKINDSRELSASVSIPLDAMFKDPDPTLNQKERAWLQPPFHPNCRCALDKVIIKRK